MNDSKKTPEDKIEVRQGKELPVQAAKVERKTAGRPDGPREKRAVTSQDAAARRAARKQRLEAASLEEKGPNPGANPPGKKGPNPGANPQGNKGPNPGANPQGVRRPKPGPKPVGGPQNIQKPPPPQPSPKVIEVRPVAVAAAPRKRHYMLFLSFVVCVVLPILAAAYYLYTYAEDQYASTVGFSVRTEEQGSAFELLGGISELTGSSSSDTDILYEYIQSQEMVSRVDERLDLRAIYSKPENDPIFSFDPSGAIEDLVDYWARVVRISYDGGTGLIELRVTAFDPQDAQNIAQAVFDESNAMINGLSQIAREDAIGYARDELELAIERLKKAREAITLFRSRTQIVDPSADIAGQMGLLNTLQEQLAMALIEADLVRQTTRSEDPRIAQADRRIDVIRQQIDQERQKFGVGGEGRSGRDYATLVAEYESLTVDREFAERAYTAALSTHDAAKAEAQRRSRYLGAYVTPTLAESSQYPRREFILLLGAGFIFMLWLTGLLVYYSFRDRA